MGFNQRNVSLFSECNLSDFMRAEKATLVSKIKGLTLEEIKKDEEILIKDLVGLSMLRTPILQEEQMKVDPRESEIEIRSEFDHSQHKVMGLEIAVQIPFEGRKELFKCRASTYSSSGTPYATVDNNEIAVNYKTTEKDPEKIEQLWKSDIDVIKKNLAWIDKDIVLYNASLENDVRMSLQRRKKEAEDNGSLIDRLKR